MVTLFVSNNSQAVRSDVNLRIDKNDEPYRDHLQELLIPRQSIESAALSVVFQFPLKKKYRGNLYYCNLN